jgi:hypothetical protein
MSLRVFPAYDQGLTVFPTPTGTTDPLVDYSFSARLQAHAGDNVPLGLYQDTACTIPATQEFDPIAAWRDELSGSNEKFVNSNTDQQPLLIFVDGVPVVSFDGVDDVLVQDGAFEPVYIAVRAQHLSDSGFGRVTTQAGGGSGGFVSTGTEWNARYGGSNILLGTITGNYDALFLQAGAGTSRYSLNGTGDIEPDNSLPNAIWAIGDYQSGGGQVIEMNLVAMYFGAAAIDAAAQTVLETYTSNLSP